LSPKVRLSARCPGTCPSPASWIMAWRLCPRHTNVGLQCRSDVGRIRYCSCDDSVRRFFNGVLERWSPVRWHVWPRLMSLTFVWADYIRCNRSAGLRCSAAFKMGGRNESRVKRDLARLRAAQTRSSL